MKGPQRWCRCRPDSWSQPDSRKDVLKHKNLLQSDKHPCPVACVCAGCIAHNIDLQRKILPVVPRPAWWSTHAIHVINRELSMRGLETKMMRRTRRQERTRVLTPTREGKEHSVSWR